MIRRPPRSTLDRSSAASDVYKRQQQHNHREANHDEETAQVKDFAAGKQKRLLEDVEAVSYTHLRAHETVLDLVCRLLLEKKKNTTAQ